MENGFASRLLVNNFGLNEIIKLLKKRYNAEYISIYYIEHKDSYRELDVFFSYLPKGKDKLLCTFDVLCELSESEDVIELFTSLFGQEYIDWRNKQKLTNKD